MQKSEAGESEPHAQGTGKIRIRYWGAVMGIGIRVMGLLGVAAGLALQPAHAGGRKPAPARHAETVPRGVVFAAQARPGFRTDVPQAMRSGVLSGRGEFSFSPVSPLESRTRSQVASAFPRTTWERERSQAGSQKGPLPPHERRNVTFFRLDPRFGDISVQPVVGGVNGAQLSVGY